MLIFLQQTEPRKYDILGLLSYLFWIIMILFLVIPYIKQKKLNMDRFRQIRKIERNRGSRVITMIHRQERLLGLPFFKYIDIQDSEQVLRAIRMTPSDMPIDFIIHTPGGLQLASEQIALALSNHKAKVSIFIPHYSMSGGTLLSLGADEIYMDENAVIGPLDPQLGQFPTVYPASSILKVVKKKKMDEIDDRTLILADVATKAVKQMRKRILEIIGDRMDLKNAKELANTLTSGKWTHDYPITFKEARELGFNVRNDIPKEIYKLMDLYPQPSLGRPSVQYIPIPYPKEGKR
jgi:ClpP class serine protease